MRGNTHDLESNKKKVARRTLPGANSVEPPAQARRRHDRGWRRHDAAAEETRGERVGARGRVRVIPFTPSTSQREARRALLSLYQHEWLTAKEGKRLKEVPRTSHTRILRRKKPEQAASPLTLSSIEHEPREGARHPIGLRIVRSVER